MNEIQFSHNLKTLRNSHHLTQEQLAEVLNTTSKSISRWENGKTMPDYTIMLALAKYFHVSLDELIKQTPIPLSDESYHHILSLLSVSLLCFSIRLHYSFIGVIFYSSTAIPLLIPLLLLALPLYVCKFRYLLHHTKGGLFLYKHQSSIFLIILATTLILAILR